MKVTDLYKNWHHSFPTRMFNMEEIRKSYFYHNYHYILSQCERVGKKHWGPHFSMIQIKFPFKNIGHWTCTDAYARHVSGQRWPLLCNRKKLLVKYIS